MIGSYGPKLEVQEFESPTDELPKGLMSLGRYLIRSRVIDDDKNVHLQWEWNLDVKKSWDWSREIRLNVLSSPPFYPSGPFPGRRVTTALFFCSSSTCFQLSENVPPSRLFTLIPPCIPPLLRIKSLKHRNTPSYLLGFHYNFSLCCRNKQKTSKLWSKICVTNKKFWSNS